MGQGHSSALSGSRDHDPSKTIQYRGSSPSVDDFHSRKGMIGPLRTRVRDATHPRPVLSPLNGTYQAEFAKVSPFSASPVDAQKFIPSKTSNHSTQSEDVHDTAHPGKSGMQLQNPPSPSILSSITSPTPSSRTEFRVSAQPRHPSIVEVPEPGEHRSSTDTIRAQIGKEEHEQQQTPRSLQSALPCRALFSDSDAESGSQRQGQDASPQYPDNFSQAASVTSSTARKDTDDVNGKTILAYWDTIGVDSPNSAGSVKRRSRSRFPTSSASPQDSPYRPVKGRWTSQWEDRRGLGISDGTDEMVEAESKILAEGKDIPYEERQGSSSLVRIQDSPTRRKPVPDHEFGPSGVTLSSKTRSSPLAPDDDIESSDGIKRRSDHSQLSAVTGALHSHVERLRAGPTFQIDSDSAADLFTPQLPDVSRSPIQRRTRKLSFVARLKGRSRKTSDATLITGLESPSKIELATPSPKTESSAVTLASPGSNAKQLLFSKGDASPTTEKVRSSPHKGLYSFARRPARKEADQMSSLPVPPLDSPVKQPNLIRRESTSSLRSAAESHISRKSERSSRRNSTGSFQPIPSHELDLESAPWWKNPWVVRKASLAAPVQSEATGLASNVETAEMENDKGIISPTVKDFGNEPSPHLIQTAPLPSPSSFSSLAPPPTPAPVPPPRRTRPKNRRGDSSSGQSSPLTATSSHRLSLREGETAKSSELQGSRSTINLPSSEDLLLDEGVIRAELAEQSDAHSPLRKTGTVLHEVRSSESQHSGVDSRDSPLPAYVDSDQPDNASSLQSHRITQAQSRKQSVPHPHVSLSPVREMITPEALFHDSQGEPSGDTAPSRHRRVNSGASMGLVDESHADISAEKRPLPAPSNIAQPHTDHHTAERSNSVSSSFAGGSAMGGQASVSSMTKHMGRNLDGTSPLNESFFPTRRADETVRSSRSMSLPSPRGQVPAGPRPPPVEKKRESLHAPVAEDGSKIRSSWMSSDGSWDAEIITAPDSQHIPSARGMSRPLVGARARSTSVPHLTNEHGQGTSSDAEGISSSQNDVAPYADTAVQASLAALQAIEQSQEENKHARWASEKLLGYSSQDAFLEAIDYSNARPRRRAAPYSRHDKDGSTSSLDGRRSRRRAKSHKDTNFAASSASQLDGLSSVMAGISSDSEFTSRQHSLRRRARKARKGLSENRSEASPTFSTPQHGLPDVQVTPPLPSNNWDEVIVPALARRLVLEAEAEQAMANMAASGLVAAVPEGFTSAPNDRRAIPKTQEDGLTQHTSVLDVTPEKEAVSGLLDIQDRKSRKPRQNRSVSSRQPEGRHSERLQGKDRSASTPSIHHTKHSSHHKSRSQSSRRGVRKGYGCDDIVAWQASLRLASVPAVAES